jgi:hypothetical protein
MSIEEDLYLRLKNNQRSIYITDADDLLGAWRHRMEKTSRSCRCFDFSRVPTEYRLSAPRDLTADCMPCHVTLHRNKFGKVTKTMKPAYEHSSIACHGHGRKKTITPQELEAMDATDAVSFARRNVAPYVSPIMDSFTLSRVCNDLGIHGRAIPKVIQGRQYIAFVTTSGARQIFPSTLYASNNRKIITMAIGALGIKNMVKNGGMLTICITVPLTIFECFLKDQATFAQLAGHLASDLFKIGISSVMGAIFGIAMGGVVTVASLPIAAAILISVLVGAGLNALDDHYNLTEKLIVVIEKMNEQIYKATENAVYETGSAAYQGFWNFLRSSGLRFHKPF